MGEYVLTTMTIGGTAPAEVIREDLAKAAGAVFCNDDDRSQVNRLIADALSESTNVTFQGERDGGRTDSLDDFCIANGLTYQRAWVSALGQFEAGLEYWNPDLTIPVELSADEGGDPVMTLNDLSSRLRRGDTLADVVAEAEKGSVKAVPLLTIATTN